MTLSLADRVFETSTTTGNGTISLAGAVPGFRSFVSGVGSGKIVPYIIDDGLNWEVGYGTITSGSPDTLTRTKVLSSSNAGGLVNWGAGVRNVRLSSAAGIDTARDENLNIIVGHGASGGSANAQTVTLNPVPENYSDGMIISWFSQGNVTGAMTVNVNGKGAKTVKWRGADLTSGAFSTGNLIFGIYKSSSGFVELITPPNNLELADGSLTFVKIAAAAIASVADIVAGTLSKIVTASNLLTYIKTYVVTPWVAYNPTFTGMGTVTGASFRSRRVGGNLEIRGKFTTGTAVASEARVSLGYNGTDSNVTSASSIATLEHCGNGARSSAGALLDAVLIEPSVGYLTFGYQASGVSSLVKQNASTIFGTALTYSFSASVPIQGWD